MVVVFFIVAGTLVNRDERAVDLAVSGQAAGEGRGAGAVVLARDGMLSSGGDPVQVADLAAIRDPALPLRVIADRAAPAGALVAVLADLQAAGFSDVAVVTLRRRGGGAP